MNVMLVGGPGILMDQLIIRFRKEGHRIFLLTGSRYREDRYERVYEKYAFPYESNSLGEIFDSASPDITIYLGAFDSNYSWVNAQSESVSFVSGVINILAAIAHRKRGRFIYLSTDEIFSGEHEDAFSEKEDVNPSTPYGVAVSQGEDLCRSYKEGHDLDVMILRLCGLYKIPQKVADCTDRVTSLCLAAMRGGFIDVSSKKVYSILNIGDAVQFICQAALAGQHKKDCYHISTGAAMGEKELAELIRDEFARIKDAGGEQRAEETSPYKAHMDIRVVEKSDNRGSVLRVVPGNEAFREEFGINRLKSPRDGIHDVVSSMVKHETVFMEDIEEELSFRQRLAKRLSWAFKALLPFIENIICFIPFFLLNNRSVGSRYFSKVDFYLLYVILFGGFYGQQQATFSALLATVGYISLQMYTRTGLEVMIDFNTYVWIAQLFIIGLSVGYLRDQLAVQKEEAKEDHSYMSDRLADIEEINGTNVRVKDSLQTQIINEDNSVGKIYAITSALDRYSADEVLFYAAEALQKIIGSDDVAIYRVSKGAYARLFTATSQKARTLGASVRYMELDGLSLAISKKQVFINRKLEPSLPMMAAAIYEEEEMRFLLMIWTLPWEKMTLGEANMLAVTGFLIQNAVLKADRYLEAIRADRYLGDTRVMKESAFRKLVAAYEKAREKSLTTYVLLTFKDSDEALLPKSDQLARKIRPNDYLGQTEDGKLCVLLTNTDEYGAGIVMERFKEAGVPCELASKEMIRKMRTEDPDEKAGGET